MHGACLKNAHFHVWQSALKKGETCLLALVCKALSTNGYESDEGKRKAGGHRLSIKAYLD
jgi:hypothetical protein